MAKLIQCIQNENEKVTPLETIKAIKDAGFDGAMFQWYNDKTWKINQLKQFRYCKKINLPIEFVHLGYSETNKIWEEGKAGDKVIKGYIKDIKKLSKFGVKMVCLHLSYKHENADPNEIGLNRFRQIVEFARTKNIKVAFENTNKAGFLEYVFERLDYDNMGVCFDSGHYHCYYNDKFTWKLFKNKIFALHLHTNDSTFDQHLLPLDPTGTLDWTDTIKKLKAAGFDGDITLESKYKSQYFKMSISKFYKESHKQAKTLLKMFKAVPNSKTKSNKTKK